MVTSAATTLYGVMHENSGGWSVIRYRDRDEAESRLYECRDDGAECYLVRARIEWVTVPDGE